MTEQAKKIKILTPKQKEEFRVNMAKYRARAQKQTIYIFYITVCTLIAWTALFAYSHIKYRFTNHYETPLVASDSFTDEGDEYNEDSTDFEEYNNAADDSNMDEQVPVETNSEPEPNGEMMPLSSTAVSIDNELLKAQVAKLQEHLIALDQKINELEVKGSYDKIIFAVMQLDEKVKSGANFSSELIKTKALARGNNNVLNYLKSIEQYAVGVDSKDALIKTFDDLSVKLVREQNKPSENATIWEKTKYNISNSVKIKKVGEVEEGSFDAIILAVENNLLHDKYFEALNEAKQLDTDNQDVKKWIQNLENTIIVKNAIDGLFQYIEAEIEAK